MDTNELMKEALAYHAEGRNYAITNPEDRKEIYR